MDIYSSFGFIDVIVAVVGVYGYYSWYMLVKKHEIKKTLLVGGDSNPAKCKDIEGFSSFMGRSLKVILFSSNHLSAFIHVLHFL